MRKEIILFIAAVFFVLVVIYVSSNTSTPLGTKSIITQQEQYEDDINPDNSTVEKQETIIQNEVSTIEETRTVISESEKLSLPVIIKEIIVQNNKDKKQILFIEFKNDETQNPTIIDSFSDEIDPLQEEMPYTYAVEYQSDAFLHISRCSNYYPAPCTDHLYDLKTFEQISLSLDYMFGTIYFFDDDKYVVSKGIGRFANIGLVAEVVDGEVVHCILSNEDVSKVEYNNGTVSFNEFKIVSKEIYSELSGEYKIVNKIADDYEIVSRKVIDIHETCR